jgi:hypothetical protein
MAGGPLLPSSIYLGGASGLLSSTVYVPATNTNAAGAIEGIGCVATPASNATAVLQFNLPEVIPTGTMKLRTLSWANATAGVLNFSVQDGQTNVGSNIGATTLGSAITYSFTWTGAAPTTADDIFENKSNLSTTPTANFILTVAATFLSTSTLAQTSVSQFSVVWE